MFDLDLDELIETTEHCAAIRNTVIVDESAKLKPVTDALAKIINVTFEDYFGKNKYIESIIHDISEIQSITVTKIGQKLDENDANRVNNIAERMGKTIAKMINVETCVIDVVGGFNIGSLPIGTGHIDLTPYKNMTDEDTMKEYNRYEVTSEGVRYVHPESKHLVIVIGISLFANAEMKPEFLAAMIVREIGCSFANYTYGYTIQAQRVTYTITETVDAVISVAQFVNATRDFIKNLPDDIDQLKNITKKKNYIGIKEEDIPMEILKRLNGIIWGDFWGYAVMIIGFIKKVPHLFHDIFVNSKRETITIQQERLERLKKVSPKRLDSHSPFQIFFDCIYQIARVWRMSLAMDAFMAFFQLSYNGEYATLGDKEKKELKKGMWKNVEWKIGAEASRTIGPATSSIVKRVRGESGNKFPAYYGLGGEYAEAMIVFQKLTAAASTEQRGWGALLRDIPIINVGVQLPLLMDTLLEEIKTGRTSSRHQIKKQYDELRKLINDPSIPPKMRQQIMEDMEMVEKAYYKFINPSNQSEDGNAARGFMYFIFRFALKLHKDRKVNEINSAMIGSATYSGSPDIRKELWKTDDKIDEEMLKSINQTVYDSSTITSESAPMFTDEDYKLFNLSITQEAYFGQTQIVAKSISYVHELRQYITPKASKLKGKEPEIVRDILNKWGKDFAKEFNVESCTVSLDVMYNAYALPTCVGNSRDVKTAANNEIIETGMGYRWKKAEGMTILIAIGTLLIADDKLSDETIVAVIFHELGHGFQQYKRLSPVIAKSQGIYSALVQNLLAIITQCAVLDISGAIANGLITIVSLIVDRFGFSKSRARYAKDFEKETKKITDGSLKYKHTFGLPTWLIDIFNVPKMIVQFLLSLVTAIFYALPIPFLPSMFATILSNPTILVDFILRFVVIKRKKEDEKFADAFAAAYGLGGELGKLFEVIDKMSYESVPQIPLIRHIIEFNMYWTISMMSLTDDHPTSRVRMESIYKSLEDELVNNKAIDQTTRQKIKDDLDSVKIQYDKVYTAAGQSKNGNYGLSFAVFVTNVMLKIKGDSSSLRDPNAPVKTSTKNVKNAIKETIVEHKDSAEALGIGSSPEKVDDVETDFSSEEQSA